MPPKQQNEQKLTAWQPTESAFIYTVCTCLAVVKFWDYNQPFLLRLSRQLAVALTDGWDTKLNGQKGSFAAKCHLKFQCAMLICVLRKKVLPWQRRGCSGARAAASPLLRQEKSCAAIDRSAAEEVPGPLWAPLVGEEAAAGSCPSVRGEGSRRVMRGLENESEKHIVCIRKSKTNCPVATWS